MRETVLTEAMVVSRHGSALMRVPTFARRPNEGMLAVPDGSGALRSSPTIDARLRLLRARRALAEHASTESKPVPAEMVAQRRLMDRIIAQYVSRTTYARWVLDTLGREASTPAAAESSAADEGTTEDESGSVSGSDAAGIAPSAAPAASSSSSFGGSLLGSLLGTGRAEQSRGGGGGGGGASSYASSMLSASASLLASLDPTLLYRAPPRAPECVLATYIDVLVQARATLFFFSRARPFLSPERQPFFQGLV